MIRPPTKRGRGTEVGAGDAGDRVALRAAWVRAAALPLLALSFALGWAMPALGVPDDVRIPMLQPREEGDPPDAALFSHWLHKRTACYSCHPSVFPQAGLGFDHDAMDDGRFCGSCHDGKTTKSFDDMECEECHVPAK